MIARLLAKRVPWRIDFAAPGAEPSFVYDFGPYKITATKTDCYERVIVERDGVKKVVCNVFSYYNASVEKAKRHAEVWIYKNNDALMRSYL